MRFEEIVKVQITALVVGAILVVLGLWIKRSETDIVFDSSIDAMAIFLIGLLCLIYGLRPGIHTLPVKLTSSQETGITWKRETLINEIPFPSASTPYVVVLPKKPSY